MTVRFFEDLLHLLTAGFVPDSEFTVADRGGGFLGWTCRARTWPPGEPVTLAV